MNKQDIVDALRNHFTWEQGQIILNRSDRGVSVYATRNGEEVDLKWSGLSGRHDAESGDLFVFGFSVGVMPEDGLTVSIRLSGHIVVLWHARSFEELVNQRLEVKVP